MKIFKILQVSIDFSTNFLKFLLASAAPPPEPPTNAYLQNSLNFSINFRENFVKILKKFSTNLEISFKIFKNYRIFIDFLNFFENFRVWTNNKLSISPMEKRTPPIDPGTPPPSTKSV